MSLILNSLIVSDSLEAQRALQDIMRDNIEGHTLTFTTSSAQDISHVNREPDLIFIESANGLSVSGMELICKHFPKKTYVALTEATEQRRRAYLAQGADEVMSLAELRSDIGKRLLEKLIALKDLSAAEARIEESEERFRGIIENSHDIIMLLDEEATVIYTSPAFGRQLGYEAWEALGQRFFALVHEEDRARVEHDLKRIMAVWADDGIALEYRIRRKDGAARRFETVATNLLRTETVRAIVLNSRDVTQQKMVEEEVFRYRQHLEELVDVRTREVEEANRRADAVVAASAMALIALDGEGHITFTSRNYLEIYPDIAEKLAPGNHITDAWEAVARESSVPKGGEMYEKMRAWLLDPHDSIEFRRPNGAWVRLHARRVPGQGGVVIATMDISDYKRQQALLAAQSAELATALAKEKNLVEQQRAFISLVSHEFRTPLAIIDGNAQIIQKRGDVLPKEALGRRAGTIRTAVDRLVRLIETILSANMLESGRLTANLSPCSLEKIIRETCSDQQDISPRHRIKVIVNGLPEAMQFDEKLIRQMMLNLLSNAVKYSPEGKIIEVEAETQGDDALIRVRDYGVGIPEDEMPKMFQRYSRASTSGDIPGSGLGLSLVKQFIELHGGTILLQSKVKEGTVVTVRLPVVRG